MFNNTTTYKSSGGPSYAKKSELKAPKGKVFSSYLNQTSVENFTVQITSSHGYHNSIDYFYNQFVGSEFFGNK